MEKEKKTKPKTKVSTSKAKASKAKVTAKKTTKTKATPAKKTSSTAKKASTPKTAKAKTTSTRKKPQAKPVVVDVILDEDLETTEDNFYSDDDLGEGKLDLETAKDFFLNLKEEVSLETSSDSEQVKIEKKANLAWSRNLAHDKQEEYFTKLAGEIDESPELSTTSPAKKAKKSSTAKKNIRLYRNLLWKFLVLVGFLIIVVFYFSFSRLIIYLTPEIETINDTLFLKVANQTEVEPRPGDARTQVSGSVNQVELSAEKTYQASGEEYMGEKITGQVTLINNSAQDQPLVATTRLLTADNKLFRLSEGVTVRAGSEITVPIYADKISREMAIGPSYFTIPGLWVGLQDKIYAQSYSPFQYEQDMSHYVKGGDINLAEDEAEGLILDKATEIKNLRSQDKTIYKIITPITTDINAKVGDRVDNFTAFSKAKVAVISLSEDEIRSLAEARLKLLVPEAKELIEFNANNLSYTLEDYDEETEVATVKVNFSGLMALRHGTELIRKESLVNLKKEQIQTYLKDFPEIGRYELKFYPSFVSRAPHLVDRIEIKVKK